MARSLKTSYLLLALGVSAVLALILGGLAYYEHRVNTADANQLTYATVEQKLEGDLEARARSLSNITTTSLAPALKEGNNAAVAAIAARFSILQIMTADIFCNPRYCRAFDGHDALYFDDNHLSISGAHKLAEAIIRIVPQREIQSRQSSDGCASAQCR